MDPNNPNTLNTFDNYDVYFQDDAQRYIQGYEAYEQFLAMMAFSGGPAAIDGGAGGVVAVGAVAVEDVSDLPFLNPAPLFLNIQRRNPSLTEITCYNLCEFTEQHVNKIRIRSKLICAESEVSCELFPSNYEEDTTYLCLHFTRNHKEIMSIMPYPEDSIRRIEDYLKILEDIERGPYSKKPPIRRSADREGITKMMINGKAAYELKGKFLDDLRNYAFSGTNGEDAVEHIENFFKIVDPLDLPNDDDHEVLTNEGFSNPEETYEDGEHEIAEIFRIETGIFDFETPLCTPFNEFNYLLKIDTDLFTHDIQEAKTYEEYEDELNNNPEEPWSEIRVPYELIDHLCKLFCFKKGKTKWPTYNYKWYDDLEDGKLKDEALKQKAMYERSWGNATQGVMNFCAWLKRCFGNFQELDNELLVKLEEYWWKMNDHECSPFTNWRNHIHETYTNTKINANYNPYLDVSRTFNNHAGMDDEEAIREERKPNDDHSIDHFDNDLVQDSAPYHTSEEEEQYEEYRREMLGNPRQEPPFCKIRRFEMIKYSFGPAEKYIAIKECEYGDLTRTEEDACYTYQGIFHIMDEGWFVTRAE
ncbi:hypothetical protein Tco_1139134 [Tanacetum coccineum]